MTNMPEVYVRDESRRSIGMLTAWHELTYDKIRNDAGSWTLTTTSAEDAALLSPPENAEGAIVGARGIIIRRAGQTIMSGWVDGTPDGKNDGTATVWEITGWDDNIHLADADCWPNPLQPINEQTDRDFIVQGAASDRIRMLALRNIVQRQGIPGFATGNPTGLGPNRRSRARFHNMLERAQAIASRDLNFEVRQRDSDRSLFLWQWLPQDKRRTVQFSPELGTVHGWSHTFTPAEATRVVIGAGGEDEDRVFREYVGHVSETELGGVRKVEKFKDRRDLSPQEPGWEDEAQEDAIEFLAEATSRGTFTIDISGSPGYEFGVDYNVGDLVRAYIGQDENSQPIGLLDDLIEEVSVTWSAEGEQAEIHIGVQDIESTNRALEREVRMLQRRLRNLEVNR